MLEQIKLNFMDAIAAPELEDSFVGPIDGFDNEAFFKRFEDAEDMDYFLKEVQDNDQWFKMRATDCMYDEENHTFPVSVFPPVAFPVFRHAIPSMEQRSFDTAKGHKYMSIDEVMHSMNNYWGKMPCPKTPGKILVRGGHVLAFNSNKYTVYGQGDVFDSLLRNICQFRPFFVSGSYAHDNTEATFVLSNMINDAYRNAWKMAGYREDMPTSVILKFNVNDIAESGISVSTFLSVNGTLMLLGDPLSKPHLGKPVADPCSFVDVLGKNIEDELNALAKMLQIIIFNPQKAIKKAAKKAGLEAISKKGLEELFENETFEKSETAYMLYMYLHGMLETEALKDVSKETKTRVYLALHRLVFEDWREFDK